MYNTVKCFHGGGTDRLSITHKLSTEKEPELDVS